MLNPTRVTKSKARIWGAEKKGRHPRPRLVQKVVWRVKSPMYELSGKGKAMVKRKGKKKLPGTLEHDDKKKQKTYMKKNKKNNGQFRSNCWG